VLGVDGLEFGREMFESTSDVSGLPPEEIISRDAKEYQSGGETICIAQIETVGKSLLERKDELLAAMGTEQARQEYRFFALMVTDILSKGTDLLVTGDQARVERTLGQTAADGVIELPGVISRKKQLAPRLLAAG
jgi:manganese-dependent inorganic pyrophosphatase